MTWWCTPSRQEAGGGVRRARGGADSLRQGWPDGGLRQSLDRRTCRVGQSACRLRAGSPWR